MAGATWMRHHEDDVRLAALPADAFALLDDHAAFSAHMEVPSWRTLGSSMRLLLDEGGGRRVGSRIRMEGRVAGLRIHLDEVVTRREPPFLKEWETTGSPRLLVVGHYRMRAEVSSEGAGSRVRVSLDYDLPERQAWLGRLLGGAYARWCVRQMTAALAARFAAPEGAVGAGAARGRAA